MIGFYSKVSHYFLKAGLTALLGVFMVSKEEKTPQIQPSSLHIMPREEYLWRSRPHCNCCLHDGCTAGERVSWMPCSATPGSRSARGPEPGTNPNTTGRAGAGGYSRTPLVSGKSAFPCILYCRIWPRQRLVCLTTTVLICSKGGPGGSPKTPRVPGVGHHRVRACTKSTTLFHSSNW